MLDQYYLAPGGQEYTLTAGKLAKLSPGSKVLDMACGRGIASINLAKKFGITATAVDVNEQFIKEGRILAKEQGVEHLVTFSNNDVFELNFPEESFDMILAEGGALSYLGRAPGMNKASYWLKKEGYLELTDMIIANEKKLPESFRQTYTDLGWNFETEESYKKLLKSTGLKTIFCSYITKQYLRTYRDRIKKELASPQGAFRSQALQKLLKEELELFYNEEWIDLFTVIFIVAQKKGGKQ